MFSFSNFTFDLNGFHLKKQKIIQYMKEENLVVNNKNNRLLMSRYHRLIVAPWKLDVLKTSIFAFEASLLDQIFVLRTSNFRRATIRVDSSETEKQIMSSVTNQRTAFMAERQQIYTNYKYIQLRYTWQFFLLCYGKAAHLYHIPSYVKFNLEWSISAKILAA